MNILKSYDFNFDNRIIIIKTLKKRLDSSDYLVFLMIFNKFYNCEKSRLYIARYFDDNFTNEETDVSTDTIEFLIENVKNRYGKIADVSDSTYLSWLQIYYGKNLFKLFDEFDPVQLDGIYIRLFLNITALTFKRALNKLEKLEIITVQCLNRKNLQYSIRLNEYAIYEFLKKDEIELYKEFYKIDPPANRISVEEYLKMNIKNNHRLIMGYLVLEFPLISSILQNNELTVSDFLIYAHIINEISLKYIFDYTVENQEEPIFTASFAHDINFANTLLISPRQVSLSIENLYKNGFIDKEYNRGVGLGTGRSIWLNRNNIEKLIGYFKSEQKQIIEIEKEVRKILKEYNDLNQKRDINIIKVNSRNQKYKELIEKYNNGTISNEELKYLKKYK